MNTHTISAVFKRNFFAYFSNPTGYVFICVFVLLCTFSAFWPAEFFNMNLANLGQLNKVYPFIMLIFIPAITMGVWAEERQRGTDELLLTLPGRDTDITIGKFLATIGIYTTSLLFASVCLYVELEWLGAPDKGLFCATFLGYWLMGVTMCAIGMIASFITGNLTVAYVFGVLFNAPLVFAVWSGNLFSDKWSKIVSSWSFSEQFAPFGRGLFSLSGLLFFIGCSFVALYVCMILISRRRWVGGKNTLVFTGHYFIRAICLTVFVACLVGVLKQSDVQFDMTDEKLNSMAPETKKLIASVQPEKPIKIEAYISPEVPRQYIQVKEQMERLLHEIRSNANDRIEVNIHYIEPLTDEALLAEKQYGIRPKQVESLKRQVAVTDEIYLAAVFSSGVEQVIIPHIDPGMSVDYELSRALATVSQKQRKRIGVVRTDVQLFSGIDFTTMSPSPDWKFIEELKLTYNVEEIDPGEKINPADWDALICVQPSTLGPEELENFLDAVKSGVPTVIFEDPVPRFSLETIPGTSEPRRPQGNPMIAMMMQFPSPPKGDITKLWELLNIEFYGNGCVYQAYNPIPRFSELSSQYICIDNGEGEPVPFNPNYPATSQLQRVLLPFTGYFVLKDNVKHETNEKNRNLIQQFLVRTGPKAGFIPGKRLFRIKEIGARAGFNVDAEPDMVPNDLVVSAWIKSKDWKKPGTPKEKNTKQKSDNINVILTADLDFLHDTFFGFHNEVLEEDIRFDNVAFVLNIIDMAVGDDSFCLLRSRRPEHRTLTLINDSTRSVREKTKEKTIELKKNYAQRIEVEEKRIAKQIENFSRQMRKQSLDQREVLQRVELLSADANKRLESQKLQLERDTQQQIQRLETQLRMEINRVQDHCKLLAVILPPIFPLTIAILVYIKRRMDESKHVNRNRRKR